MYSLYVFLFLGLKPITASLCLSASTSEREAWHMMYSPSTPSLTLVTSNPLLCRLPQGLGCSPLLRNLPAEWKFIGWQLKNLNPCVGFSFSVSAWACWNAEAEIGACAGRDRFSSFQSQRQHVTKKKEAVQKWLHHISKEERQENKMAGLMSICSGGLERTGPAHAGLGPSLGFKGNIQLDFRLHSLRMLVWKQTSSGFKGEWIRLFPSLHHSFCIFETEVWYWLIKPSCLCQLSRGWQWKMEGNDGVQRHDCAWSDSWNWLFFFLFPVSHIQSKIGFEKKKIKFEWAHVLTKL